MVPPDEKAIRHRPILALQRAGELDAEKFFKQVIPKRRAAEQATEQQGTGKQFPLIQESSPSQVNSNLVDVTNGCIGNTEKRP